MFYGRYTNTSDYVASLNATYSYQGVVEILYLRSTVITEDVLNNSHNEYILRGYLFNGKRFFVSGAIGYQDYFAETELWNDFYLEAVKDGFFIEGGLHLATIDDESKKIVVSLFYRLFESIERISTYSINSSSTIKYESKLERGLTFDAALVYYLGSFGLVIGPRLKFENNFEFASVGINLSLMLIH
jgi:hypothetical protein